MVNKLKRNIESKKDKLTEKSVSKMTKIPDGSPEFKGFDNQKTKNKGQIVNKSFIEEKFNSDDEYLPFKYPRDNKFQDFLNNFQILSQDLKQATSSSSISGTKQNKNSNINMKNSKKDKPVQDYNISIIFQFMSDIKQSMEFINAEFEILKEDNKELRNNIKDLQSIKKENEILKKNIVGMEEKIHLLEQEEKNKNIVLSGIREEKNEDLNQITKKFFKIINFEVKSDEIKHVRRINSKNQKNNKTPILIELKNKEIKNEVFKKRKERGLVFAEEMGFKNDQGIIYINENLTLANQILFKKARDKKREIKFKYVWTKNGKIFMRKNDNSKIIYIQHEADLDDLIL